MKPGRVKILVTVLIAGVAATAVLLKYRHYLENPWTRDGQVRAIVITVAPRVTGPIVNLPIVDNQFVKAGDLLFEIDPRTFLSALHEAQANLDLTIQNLVVLDKNAQAAAEALSQSEAMIKESESDIEKLRAEFDLAEKNYLRARDLVGEAAIAEAEFDQNKENRDATEAQLAQGESALLQAKAARRQAQADLDKAIAARGPLGQNNPQLRAAKAALEDAALNYEFTRQYASVDGYVTNLNLRIGAQAVANQPALALVDASSFWVAGYFMETQIADMRSGQPAVVTFMSYPDIPVPGVVESIGWGIFQTDGSDGKNLLPDVNPTFEWIRLAQRIPVRVRAHPPEGVKLRVGMTASVLVMTGEDAATATGATGLTGAAGEAKTPPVPKALQ